MKLRRFMQIARRGRSLPKGSIVRHSKIGQPTSASGQSLHIDKPRASAQCPLHPNSGQTFAPQRNVAKCQ
jgi:hypothetical protein